MAEQPQEKAGSVSFEKSLFTDYDSHLFKEGNHFHVYENMGSHILPNDGSVGTYFAVWAPNAVRVSVIGDFNGWDPNAHHLVRRWNGSGVWEGFIPGVAQGSLYKYRIISRNNNYAIDKGDPFAFYWEISPRTASVIWDLDYQWQDDKWMKERGKHNNLQSPVSIYEVHLGSWQRKSKENNRFLTYRESAHALARYVKEMGFTHVELLPVMEHPFYGSWGYQVVGYFAPTSRYGTPQDFMYLVDHLHQHGIGVILDWVPAQFPSDENGLAWFDGTHLYEYADPRKGFHPDWKSFIFNYGRNEVRNFLISNALFWLKKYHLDALRVDAVASMLYLDYSRRPGQWIPNEYGGRENLEAISFLKQFNEVIYKDVPDTQTIAEESTAWPMVSRPLYVGGLGFGLKWNMGWMHDALDYFSQNPIYRKYRQNQLTFSIWYAFSENYVLPLSHDEVVYEKGSLIGKMPGDDWQKFANLRLLLGYMYTHPGKKLLFMGGEFAQRNEWNHEMSLDWQLLQYPAHKGIQKWVRDLNYLYRHEPALYELDCQTEGFRWIDFNDWEKSVVSFIRQGTSTEDILLVAGNFTPVPRFDYRIGVPRSGYYQEVLNSDATIYGGVGYGNFGGLDSAPVAFNEYDNSLVLNLPPLSIVVFKNKKTQGADIVMDGVFRTSS